MNIETKYELKQKVKILPLDGKIGTIDGIYIGFGGIKYYISYYVDYDEKENYFYEEDVCPV